MFANLLFGVKYDYHFSVKWGANWSQKTRGKNMFLLSVANTVQSTNIAMEHVPFEEFPIENVDFPASSCWLIPVGTPKTDRNDRNDLLSTKVMAPATFASQLPGFKIFEDLQVGS